jgi:hypothetical protein
MVEKLTLKKLSDELKTLHTQMQDMEQRLDRKIEVAVAAAVAGLNPGTTTGGHAGSPVGVDAEQRQQMIAEQAYLIAELRGFQGGDPCQDWREAEKRVNAMLMEQSGPRKTPARTRKPAGKKSGSKVASRAK